MIMPEDETVHLARDYDGSEAFCNRKIYDGTDTVKEVTCVKCLQALIDAMESQKNIRASFIEKCVNDILRTLDVKR